MRVLPGRPERLARLCQIMYLGERVAQRCAQQQATLAGDARQSRFLRQQARQEAMHARLFRGIVARLDPRGNHSNIPAAKAMAVYETQLLRDIERRDLAASLLGMQDTLEGIGERMLLASDRFVSGQSARYRRLHRMVVLQEASHHAFGKHWLKRGLNDGHASRSITLARERYGILAHDLLSACGDILEDIGIDAGLAFNPATTPYALAGAP